MNILIVPDAYKECLDVFSVTECLASGLLRGASCPPVLVRRPLADGGEGLMDVMLNAWGGTTIKKSVTGPCGEQVSSAFAMMGDGRTAVIEMARAAGLHLAEKSQRNPMHTTTRGVGELIKHALDAGAERIIVGLGGSATNDGGAGMAQALGVSLVDEQGRELPPGCAPLQHLSRIELSRMDARLRDVEVIGACDVTNPLCGMEGASFVYGPQKGASADDVVMLDNALNHFGVLLERHFRKGLLDLPGGGAAGGLGAGLAAFAGATLQSGVDLVFEAYGDLEEKAQTADAIVSGEGRVDAQTIHGKVISGVAALARRWDKPLFVLAGGIKGDIHPLYERGVTAAFSIAPGPISEQESILGVQRYLEDGAEALMRCIERMAGHANVS